MDALLPSGVHLSGKLAQGGRHLHWVGRSFPELAQCEWQGVQNGVEHAVIGRQPADEDPPHAQVLKAAMQFRALELRVARIGRVPLETMVAVAGRSRSGEKAALTIMGVG